MPYIGNNHVAGDHVNNFKVLDDISSYTATFDGSASAVVSTSNNTIRVPEHRFIQGQRVTYNNGGGGNIAGLVSGTAYFVSFDTANTIRLATSLANANNNTVINLTNVGSGSSHTLIAAFDGINKKFKLTHGGGISTRLNHPTQINVAINNVVQKPNLNNGSFTEGFSIVDNHKIIFKTAPISTDIFWGSVIANTITTFDVSDHKIDTFTGDGTTTDFNLSHDPANNESIIVTINGVLQHPSNTTTSRAYTLLDNILQFTAAPANGDEIQVRHMGFAGATTADVSGFYGRTGNVVLTSNDHITTGNINAGIVTATTFVGSFSPNIGGSNANFTGIVTAANFKGGDFEGRNLKITGLSTFVGDAEFSGNVSIAGTLTYEDVTNIDSVGLITAREGIAIPDSRILSLGDRNVGSSLGDLRLYHNGSDSYIDEVGAGNLYIRNGSKNSIWCQTDGPVHLYHNNNTKLSTSNTGVSVSGSIVATGEIKTLTLFESTSGNDLRLNAGSVNRDIFLQVNDTTLMTVRGSTSNVGIGTDNPAKKLEVFDDTQGVIRIRGGGGGSNSSRKADLSLFASGAREYVVRADASDAAFKIIDVSDSNAERLRIKSDGKVVIGDTNTTAQLGVVRDSYYLAEFTNTNADATGAELSLRKDSASPADNDSLGLLNFIGDNDAGQKTTYAYIRSKSTDVSDGTEDGTLEFHTRGNGTISERVRINSTGAIQITPEGSTSNPYMLIDTSGDSVRFSAKKSSGNNAFRFLTQSSGSVNERLRITSDGKVKICHVDGADPTEPLHVVATAVNQDIARFTGANKDRGLVISTSVSGSTNDSVINYDADSQNSVGQHVFKTDGNERLRIDANGDINLGNNPTNQYGYKLNIQDSAIIYAQTASSGGLEAKWHLDNSAQLMELGTVTTDNLALVTNNTPRLTITSGGDVGVGNDSPNCKLAIKDTAEHTAYANVTPTVGNSMLQLYNNPPNETANDHATIQFGVNGGSHNRVNTISAVAESAGNRKLAFTFCTDEAGSRTEKLRITGDGKIGIGTAVPDQNLELFKASGTNLVKVSTQANSTIGLEIEKTGSTTQTWRIVDGQTANGALEFYDVTDSATRLMIDTSGRILINRTSTHSSSSERLSVNGMTSIQNSSTSTAPLYVVNEETTSDGTVQPFTYFYDGSGLRAGIGVQRSTSRTIINGQFGLSFRTGASGVGGTERLLIGTDGSVTIAETMAVNRPRIVLSAPDDGTSYRHLFGANLQVNSSGTYTTPTANISGGGWEYLPANSLNAHGKLRYLSAPDTNATSSTPEERLRIDATGRVLIGLELSTQNDSYMQVFKKTGNSATITVGNVATSASGLCRIDFCPSNKVVGSRIECHATEDFSTTANRTADLVFITRKDGVNSEKLRITSGGNVMVGNGADTPYAPLHVYAENNRGLNAIFGKGFVDNAAYHYDDANIQLNGRDVDGNDTGSGIEFNTRNTGNTNWLHGAITQDRSGNINFINGGAGLTVGTERFRITNDGYLNFYNNSNTAKGLRWYNNVGGSAKAATIEWGNGSANWEFRHFRNDDQANNPYANIDFYTGGWTTSPAPTRALRITNDGNHIREKHSRFSTRVAYSTGNEGAATKIAMKDPHINVGNDFSDSDDRYVAPVDGDYVFWFFTNVIKSGSGTFWAEFRVNGSSVYTDKGGIIYTYYAGSGWENLSGCIMLRLDEGDYVEVYNGSQAVNYDGNNYGQFMGWLLG